MSTHNRAPARAVPLPFYRRNPLLTALVPVVLVILALATMVVIKTTGGAARPPVRSSTPVTGAGGTAGGTAGAGGVGTTALPAGVLADVTSVSASTLASVGDPSSLAAPVKTSAGSVLLASDGKPEVLYIGAEFCPFCAAERWAVVEALSRFGTFTGLSATHSSTTDIYPDTRTFSFYGSGYSSPYLDFVPVETETNQPDASGYSTLQTPTAAEQSVLASYDVSPYTSEPGSIPFLDIGNRFVISGASYTPQVLQGLTMRQIAAQLDDASSVVAEAIDGTANLITASLCSITGDQPARVCATPTIAAIAKRLGA